MDEKNIHAGHRDRMRERFLKTGLLGFSEHEKLEFLLYHCLIQKDTNRLAHRLISEFGSLAGVLSANEKELMRVDGVGKNTAVFLKFIGEMLNDTEGTDTRTSLKTPEQMAEYLSIYFERANVENVVVLSLDKDRKPLRVIRISEGSFDTSTIPIAKIARTLVNNSTVFAAVAHNHVSGIAFPSVQDIRTTEKLRDTLSMVGIELVDHIIFVPGDYVSLSASGDKIYTM